MKLFRITFALLTVLSILGFVLFSDFGLKTACVFAASVSALMWAISTCHDTKSL